MLEPQSENPEPYHRQQLVSILTEAKLWPSPNLKPNELILDIGAGSELHQDPQQKLPHEYVEPGDQIFQPRFLRLCAELGIPRHQLVAIEPLPQSEKDQPLFTSITLSLVYPTPTQADLAALLSEHTEIKDPQIRLAYSSGFFDSLVPSPMLADQLEAHYGHPLSDSQVHHHADQMRQAWSNLITPLLSPQGIIHFD